MRKTYRYKIVNQKNTIKLGNLLDDLHRIHVHIMRLQRRYYRMYGKNISAYRMNAHVAKLKKRTKPHWADLPSQVVQDVVLRMGKAYDAFFRNIKERKAGKTTKKVGKPHIKPQHICTEYDTLCFETLNTDGMKRLWGRKISDLAFYQFIEILKYKSIKHDCQFLQVGQWTATTKPCSDCGHHNEKLELNDRQWICPQCESLHDRDINAAINISQAGIAA